MQQKIGSFVGRKAPRKTQCQRVGVKQMLRLFNRLGRCSGGGIMSGQPFTGVFHQRLAGSDAKLPKIFVGDAANILFQSFRRPQPTVFATGLRPEFVGSRRIPGRHVNSVRYMADGNFILRPVRK